ncbi:MAG: hypothetical protein HY289_06065 [Planctomycetes bacterium]|nr:hypothetical protein [Planctomycetota bacterium]
MEDDEADDWARGVAEIWARDWSDPREDIYTLDDDEPVEGNSPEKGPFTGLPAQR